MVQELGLQENPRQVCRQAGTKQGLESYRWVEVSDSFRYVLAHLLSDEGGSSLAQPLGSSKWATWHHWPSTVSAKPSLVGMSGVWSLWGQLPHVSCCSSKLHGTIRAAGSSCVFVTSHADALRFGLQLYTCLLSFATKPNDSTPRKGNIEIDIFDLQY